MSLHHIPIKKFQTQDKTWYRVNDVPLYFFLGYTKQLIHYSAYVIYEAVDKYVKGRNEVCVNMRVAKGMFGVDSFVNERIFNSSNVISYYDLFEFKRCGISLPCIEFLKQLYERVGFVYQKAHELTQTCEEGDVFYIYASISWTEIECGYRFHLQYVVNGNEGEACETFEENDDTVYNPSTWSRHWI